MIPPDTETVIRTYVFDRIRHEFAQRIPGGELRIQTMRDYANYLADNIIVRVTTDVLGQMKPVEHLHATHDHPYRYPATWWDHWKETHTTTWWARWWIYRHPPRYTTRTARFETVIPVERRVLFPEADIELPPLGEPVQVIAPQESIWTQHDDAPDTTKDEQT